MFINSNQLGEDPYGFTRFENINQFVVRSGRTVKVVGTLIVKAKTITIEGTLDGTGGGYPGFVLQPYGDANNRGDVVRRFTDGGNGTDPTCHLDFTGACREDSDRPKNIDGKGRGGRADFQGKTCNVGGGGGAGHGSEGGAGGDGGDFLIEERNFYVISLFDQPFRIGGAGGAFYDDNPLLLPGSGGGGGAGCSEKEDGRTGGQREQGGPGGAGGAAIYLFASEITINGRILVNGEGARDEAQTNDTAEGGGGGGSGGSLTLSACKINFGEKSELRANGGNGGAGAIGKNLEAKPKIGAGGGGGGGVGIIWIQAREKEVTVDAKADPGSGGGKQGVGIAGEKGSTRTKIFLETCSSGGDDD
mmetsp:Transcript_9845/g.21323  ORF Transcript_9845/g.21323 Transcript_9845/m.21323 type:complete len:361 (+) Transcript_9845:668-1750(+)